MRDNVDQLKQRIAALEREVAALKSRGYTYRSIRKRSSRQVWGLPWYDIAMGPDPEKGELRGHARGIIAVGDIATGVLAVGGLARGIVAVGGLALGALVGVGGLAVGGIAVGGAAVGFVAIGGGAAGYYALGGSAFGGHVIDGMRQNPEAVRFFREWLPGFGYFPPA
ncbi:MAG: hypothetical protein U5O69_10920 [Candidatus Competibacteraceae bacterium]|nr:hypothetical protein [Candidatus Competibacteraceae bacterium]